MKFPVPEAVPPIVLPTPSNVTAPLPTPEPPMWAVRSLFAPIVLPWKTQSETLVTSVTWLAIRLLRKVEW